MSAVSLTILYHDPQGLLLPAIAAHLPLLQQVFDGIAICASPVASAQALAMWRSAGALIDQETPEDRPAYLRLGAARQRAVLLALQHSPSHLLYCDADRILHWAARFPDELRHLPQRLSAYDFTVLGRTPRAFDTHPAVQRDTERIVNKVFAQQTGWAWDVGSGARGLSRQAVEALAQHCDDAAISVDVTWPLCLHRLGGFELGYFTLEGLEFETGDGYNHQPMQGMPYHQWLDTLDADPQRWVFRLRLAQLHIENMQPYLPVEKSITTGTSRVACN